MYPDVDLTNEPDWKQALCRKQDANIFFPERGTAQRTAAESKAICNGIAGRPACPELATCLEYAIDRRERFGIWGGKSERERARIVRERKRAAELEAERQEQIRQRRKDAAKRAAATRAARRMSEQDAKIEASTRSKSRGTSKARGTRTAVA